MTAYSESEWGQGVSREGWWSVRYLVYIPAFEAYEERITLWQCESSDEAIELALREADEYAEILNAAVLSFVESYRLVDPPGHGREVFSLLRRSDLDQETYVERFSDTGEECRRKES